MSEAKKNSNLPIIIIGVVLVVAVFGGWWLYSRPKAPVTPPANQQQPKENFSELYKTAPPGASPPNVKGDQNATIVLEEFADFACPTCAAVHPRINELHNKFGNRIKIIFRHFPLSIQGHHNSYNAACATEAAGLQGKFGEMQNLIFNDQKKWQTLNEDQARKVFEDYAKQIGLNVDKFTTDMLGFAARSRVDADAQRAKHLKLNSTPSFILNGRLLGLSETTSEKLSALIEAELVKQSGGQPAANSK